MVPERVLSHANKKPCIPIDEIDDDEQPGTLFPKSPRCGFAASFLLLEGASISRTKCHALCAATRNV